MLGGDDLGAGGEVELGLTLVAEPDAVTGADLVVGGQVDGNGLADAVAGGAPVTAVRPMARPPIPRARQRRRGPAGRGSSSPWRSRSSCRSVGARRRRPDVGAAMDAAPRHRRPRPARARHRRRPWGRGAQGALGAGLAGVGGRGDSSRSTAGRGVLGPVPGPGRGGCCCGPRSWPRGRSAPAPAGGRSPAGRHHAAGRVRGRHHGRRAVGAGGPRPRSGSPRTGAGPSASTATRCTCRSCWRGGCGSRSTASGPLVRGLVSGRSWPPACSSPPRDRAVG